MSQVRQEAPDLVERIRRGLAPPVALLASALGISCLLSVVGVLRSLPELSALDARFVGWVGLGATACLAVVAVALLVVERAGAGPALSLGAVAAVFGLSLGHRVAGHEQLTLAALVGGLAAGALLGGGIGMTSALPRGWARAAVTAWAIPLVAAWPAVTWLLPDRDVSRLPDVVVHPAAWVLAGTTVVIVAWGLMTMLVEPVGPTVVPTVSREDVWSALLLLSAVAVLLTTLLGFDPQIALLWLRPVVIVAAAAVLVGWALITFLLATLTDRIAYVAVSAVAWLVPATITFAAGVADSGQTPVSWPVASLLASAAAVGALLGSRGLLAVVPLGCAVVAGAAAGAWVMSDRPWVALAAAAPLVAAATAVTVTALHLVVPDARASRLVGLAAICALVLGEIVTIPLSWALLGQVPAGVDDMMAAGRLYAGLTVAAMSLAAAWTWLARGRLLRL